VASATEAARGGAAAGGVIHIIVIHHRHHHISSSIIVVIVGLHENRVAERRDLLLTPCRAAPTAYANKQWARRFRRRAGVTNVESRAGGDSQPVQAKVAERRRSFLPVPARKNGARSGTATRAQIVARNLW